VISKGSISLEVAVQKLTSGPAKKLGLKKRGEIKVGNFADLVIFDEKLIKDNATYTNPYQYSSGIDYVFVNGKAVLAEGNLTQKLPGYVLRKS
jgi:N-acyl-D-amino-acid deacylase